MKFDQGGSTEECSGQAARLVPVERRQKWIQTSIETVSTLLCGKKPLKYYNTATKEDWHRKTVSKRDKLQSDLAAGLNIDGTRYRYRWTGVSPMATVATEG